MMDFLVLWFIVNAVIFLVEGILFAALLVMWSEMEGRNAG